MYKQRKLVGGCRIIPYIMENKKCLKPPTRKSYEYPKKSLEVPNHLPIQATSRSADIRTELRPDDLTGCFWWRKQRMIWICWNDVQWKHNQASCRIEQMMPMSQRKSGWFQPLWKILVSWDDMGWLSHILWNINNVWNHQPEIHIHIHIHKTGCCTLVAPVWHTKIGTLQTDTHTVLLYRFPTVVEIPFYVDHFSIPK